MDRPCPCGSRRSFAACCGPYLGGRASVPTAEALMRSRYTAYCEGAADYLLQTHRGAGRTAADRDVLRRSIAGTEWVNLLILDTQKGRETDTTGIVEFVAALRPKASLLHPGPIATEQMHERSRFVRDNGRWLYADGDQLAPHRTRRNEACWCGSGRKTKQCHS